MSYFTGLASLPWDWVLLGGGVGGTLNAAFSSNLRLFPAWSPNRWGHTRYVATHVGLLVSALVGAGAATALLWPFLGVVDVETETKPMRLLASCIVVGFIAARWLTSEVDKMLLRLAVKNAAAAPAAHPEIAQALDHAPPYAVYRLATEMAPPRHAHATRPLRIRPPFEKAEPQRL